METFSALLALCEGNSPVTGEFLSQRPVTRSFDVFFVLRLNKRLSKPSRRRWFSCLLWRHCNEVFIGYAIVLSRFVGLIRPYSLCVSWVTTRVPVTYHRWYGIMFLYQPTTTHYKAWNVSTIIYVYHISQGYSKCTCKEHGDKAPPILWWTGGYKQDRT